MRKKSLLKQYKKERIFFELPKTAEEMAIEIYPDSYKSLRWKAIGRVTVPITEMTSNHVSNCIAFLKKCGDSDTNIYWSTIFRLELMRRDQERKRSTKALAAINNLSEI